MSHLQLASYYDRLEFLSGCDEISQVPYKERLHVHGVYDCARCVNNLPFASSPLLSSASYNRIDTLNLNYLSTYWFDAPAEIYLPTPPQA